MMLIKSGTKVKEVLAAYQHVFSLSLFLEEALLSYVANRILKINLQILRGLS